MFLVEKTDNEAFQCVFFFWQDAKKTLRQSIVFVVVLPLQSKGL